MKWTVLLLAAALPVMTMAPAAEAHRAKVYRCEVSPSGYQPASRVACYRGCLGWRVRAACNRWCDNHCRY